MRVYFFQTLPLEVQFLIVYCPQSIFFYIVHKFKIHSLISIIRLALSEKENYPQWSLLGMESPQGILTPRLFPMTPKGIRLR